MSASRTEFVTVARVGEIPEGGVKIVRIEDQELAVFHVEGGYHVIEDVCTHDGGPLAEGVLEGRVIECPRHGARFDVTTGEVLAPPAVAPVPRYDVSVRGDQDKAKGEGANKKRCTHLVSGHYHPPWKFSARYRMKVEAPCQGVDQLPETFYSASRAVEIGAGSGFWRHARLKRDGTNAKGHVNFGKRLKENVEGASGSSGDRRAGRRTPPGADLFCV